MICSWAAADCIIAVNMSRMRFASGLEIPNALESVLGIFEIMHTAMLADKLERLKPDIYITGPSW